MKMDDLFVIDTQRDEDLLRDDTDVENDAVADVVEDEIEESESEDGDFGGLPAPSKDISHIIRAALRPKKPVLLDFQRPAPDTKEKNKKKKQNINLKADPLIDEIIQSSVAKELVLATIESSTDLDKNAMSNRKLIKLRRAERANTKGKGWFDMKAPELTEDLKNELEVIKMRNTLDSKRFYKRSEAKTLPKFFEVGKVIASPLDHYQERNQKVPKTLVDELLADAEFQKRNKRKYHEAMEKKKSTGYYKLEKMKQHKKRK